MDFRIISQIFISASAMYYQSYGGSVRIYFRINYQHSFQILDKWLLLVNPITVNQRQQAAQEWATYRPLCGASVI